MKISIIGTGYVGLVTGVCLAEKGNFIICVDKIKEKVDPINAGKSPVYEQGLNKLLIKNINNGHLVASMDLKKAVQDTDISIIAVGTPNNNGEIDLSEIRKVAREVGQVLKEKEDYHVVTVKSTVVPKTTDTIVKNILESTSGKKAGEFGLCMNPEFLREGSTVEDFMNPDRIVIGAFDERSATALLKVYDDFDCPKLVTNLRTAEMIKYTANSLLATLISFSNEIASICEGISDIDVTEVLQWVHFDKRFMPFILDERTKKNKRVKPGMISYLWAGCGYGGSCFPKDVQALYAFAKEQKLEPKILRSTIEINKNQPLRLFERAKKSLGTFRNKKVAILGLSFKPNTDDMRETPAIPIIENLLADGAKVICHDPIAMENAKNNVLKEYDVEFASSKEDAIEGAEVVFLITSWKEYYEISPEQFRKSLKGKYPMTVDGRRIYNKKDMESQGIHYIGVGLK